MQTLAAEIAFTLIDDATALTTGAVRMLVRLLVSPVERLAQACDVAGVLPGRRSARPRGHDEPARSGRRRLFSFHLLNHLT